MFVLKIEFQSIGYEEGKKKKKIEDIKHQQKQELQY